MARIRRYSELSRIDSFEERFEYLSLRGTVGESTFGFERHINQSFYRSVEWRQLRHHVIARDLGCDMGFPEHEIHDRVIIHHMNPMTVDEIVHGEEQILNPDFLITVSHNTHNAIHYGDSNLLPKPLIERRPGDTRLW
jgi:hypothetical protein